MKRQLALCGAMSLIQALAMGHDVVLGRGHISTLVLLLAVSLALTALQFLAVTSTNRSSKFVRFWAAWQGRTLSVLSVYTMLISNQLVIQSPQDDAAIVFRWVIFIGGAFVIASAVWELFKLLRRGPPMQTT